MLRELNDKHLKIIAEKQADINCLQQKLVTLDQFRNSCMEEERSKLEATINFLEGQLQDLENERDDLRRIVSNKDYQIDNLERQKNELELALSMKEEKLLVVRELNEQICNLKVSNEALEEKTKWLQEQREREKENFETLMQKEFNEKWQMIIEKIEERKDGGAGFDELKKTIEELRNSIDNSEEFKHFQDKFNTKLKYLEENLEKERSTVKAYAGEKAELACKLEGLEDQLKAMKLENVDMKQRLSDEKCVQVKMISEMEVEIEQLKMKISELKYSEWCINGCPVNITTEIEMYKSILESKGFKLGERSKERKDSSSSSSSEGSQIDAIQAMKKQTPRGLSISSLGQQAARQASKVSSSRMFRTEVKKSETKIG